MNVPQIYVAGGHNGETILNTAEKFEPDTELWMTLAPMNMERWGTKKSEFQIAMDRK